jgi:hypothetical protein
MCGGGTTVVEAPQPSQPELEIQQAQLEEMKRQAAFQESILPEWTKMQQEQIALTSAQQEMQNELMPLTKDYYESQLALAQQSQQYLQDILNQPKTEYEQMLEDVGISMLERQQKALAGELPLPEYMTQQKADELAQLEEKLSRSGAAVGSTPYVKSMSEFEQRWQVAEDLAKRGEISDLGSLSLQTVGLSSDIANRDYSQAAGLSGISNLYGNVGYGNTASAFGNINYGNLLQPYQYYSGLQLKTNLTNAQMANKASSSTMGAIGGLLGTGIKAYGSYAGMAALAASSKRLKKNIKPINLTPVIFEYTDEALEKYPEITEKGKQIGFIAEEVANDYPEAVIFDELGKSLAINYAILKEVA